VRDMGVSGLGLTPSSAQVAIQERGAFKEALAQALQSMGRA
jgi:hypothetical protein